MKCSGQDSEPKGMGWGWTNGGTARSKSSGLWKKKQEAQVLPSMQWSGDGKQETGVLPVDQEEREEHELEGDEISPRPG